MATTTTVSDLRPVSEFIEEAIEYPLNSLALTSFSVSVRVLERLATAMEEYERQFFGESVETSSEKGASISLPTILIKKPPTEQWVGCFHQNRIIATDRTVSSQLLGGVQHEKQVKKLLLFCHGIFVDMPEFMAPSRWGGAITPAQMIAEANDQLLSYAGLEGLIRRKIMIPAPILRMRPINFEDPWIRPYGNLNLPPKDESLVRKIARNIVRQRQTISESEAKLSVIRAIMARADSKGAADFYDPFFRDDPLAALAFGEVILELERSISSQDRVRPAMIEKLNAQFTIKPDLVSVNDIIHMRENEDIFDLWRKMIQEGLEWMITNEGRYNDSGKEFSEFIESHGREWREKAAKATGKGVWSTIKDGAQDTTLSFISGLIGGTVIDPSKGLLIGLASGSIKSLLQMFGSIVSSSTSRDARISLNNHILAVGGR